MSLAHELCRPLGRLGATDPVTATDLRRVLGNLATFLTGEAAAVLKADAASEEVPPEDEPAATTEPEVGRPG